MPLEGDPPSRRGHIERYRITPAFSVPGESGESVLRKFVQAIAIQSNALGLRGWNVLHVHVSLMPGREIDIVLECEAPHA